MASEQVRQRIYLLQELDVSILTIEAGLTELYNSRPYRPRHFVFLLLLATGIERLLKIILHLQALESTGSFLSKQDMMHRYRHDLVGLCGAVVSECFTPAHLSRAVTQQDLSFIQNDQTFLAMLNLLSDFAKRDRYLFMDGISDPGASSEWPQRRWDEIESSTLPAGEFARLYVDGREQEAKSQATQMLVARFERFIRAMARLFVFGALGDQARQVSPPLSTYLMLNDEDLGDAQRSQPR